MTFSDRIRSFEMLGEMLLRYHEHSADADMEPLLKAAERASRKNSWFTDEQVRYALNSLGQALRTESLKNWLAPYGDRILQSAVVKNVGVVMAGNIPAVGFHDFLCVLISGHRLIVKLSASDHILIPAMADILTGYLPEWHKYVAFTDGKLEKFDAVIATGSTNTSRYFEYYFGKYPHIIRRNRNSIAILSGNENIPELEGLAGDIMLFFGMGCRSVSKIYVPFGYDFSRLVRALERYGHYADHNKYRNNYDYRRSIFQAGNVPFLDAGVLLLREEREISSPIAVLHYEYYQDPEPLINSVREKERLIQCVISATALPFRSADPGEAQRPALWDYADQVDTMEFLLSIK